MNCSLYIIVDLCARLILNTQKDFKLTFNRAARARCAEKVTVSLRK